MRLKSVEDGNNSSVHYPDAHTTKILHVGLLWQSSLSSSYTWHQHIPRPHRTLELKIFTTCDHSPFLSLSPSAYLKPSAPPAPSPHQTWASPLPCHCSRAPSKWVPGSNWRVSYLESLSCLGILPCGIWTCLSCIGSVYFPNQSSYPCTWGPTHGTLKCISYGPAPVRDVVLGSRCHGIKQFLEGFRLGLACKHVLWTVSLAILLLL